MLNFTRHLQLDIYLIQVQGKRVYYIEHLTVTL